jgi:hypothetical protein
MPDKDVTLFLDQTHHPLRAEIEALRITILKAHKGLRENIKWNGPNYSINDEDRITMKIQPPKQIQLIFHRGAKKQEQPKDKLIRDTSGILVWKENDRAIASFSSMDEIKEKTSALTSLVKAWIKATS